MFREPSIHASRRPEACVPQALEQAVTSGREVASSPVPRRRIVTWRDLLLAEMDVVEVGVQTSNASICLGRSNHDVEVKKMSVQYHRAPLHIAGANAGPRLTQRKFAAINGDAHMRHWIRLRARGGSEREAPIVDAKIAPRVNFISNRRLQFAPVLPEFIRGDIELKSLALVDDVRERESKSRVGSRQLPRAARELSARWISNVRVGRRKTARAPAECRRVSRLRPRRPVAPHLRRRTRGRQASAPTARCGENALRRGSARDRRRRSAPAGLFPRRCAGRLPPWSSPPCAVPPAPPRTPASTPHA